MTPIPLHLMVSLSAELAVNCVSALEVVALPFALLVSSALPTTGVVDGVASGEELPLTTPDREGVIDATEADVVDPLELPPTVLGDPDATGKETPAEILATFAPEIPPTTPADLKGVEVAVSIIALGIPLAVGTDLSDEETDATMLPTETLTPVSEAPPLVPLPSAWAIGQTVVETAIVLVMICPTGQFVTVDGHLVTVSIFVA